MNEWIPWLINREIKILYSGFSGPLSVFLIHLNVPKGYSTYRSSPQVHHLTNEPTGIPWWCPVLVFRVNRIEYVRSGLSPVINHLPVPVLHSCSAGGHVVYPCGLAGHSTLREDYSSEGDIDWRIINKSNCGWQIKNGRCGESNPVTLFDERKKQDVCCSTRFVGKQYEDCCLLIPTPSSPPPACIRPLWHVNERAVSD